MTFRKMLFCLAEAARDNLRAALRRAVSASVQQDVRKAQLLLRITCCDEGLRITSAALGQCDLAATGFGQSAVGLMQGTMYIMTKLCTPLLCVPGRACTTQEPDVDMELLTHVRESVTLFAADGAGDEQLAGELSKVEIFPKMLFKMRGQCHGPCCVCYAIRDRRAQAKALSSMRRKTQPTRTCHVRCMQTQPGPQTLQTQWSTTRACTNVVHATHDSENARCVSCTLMCTDNSGHGVKRVLSRTWPSDPVLNRISDQLVLSSGAVLQRIRHSDVFRNRFAKYVRCMAGHEQSRVKDMASAKHRFTSHCRPFGRACLYLEALIRTAQSILDERGPSSPEGKDSRGWLSSLDEETVILLGLMSDVSDETMALNRFFDQDHFDKSAIHMEVDRFLRKTTWLIEARGALETGYTKYLLQFLQEQRTIIIDGRARSLGGKAPSSQTVERCFSRMRNWLQVVRHTIRAEFPEFAMVRAFEVFNLESDTGPRLRAEHLEKLAATLGVDNRTLEAQLVDMWPMAKANREAGKDNHEAWRLAIQRTRASANGSRAHPHETLVKVLASHCAWDAGTSTIERNFSLVHCLTSWSRGPVGETLADDELQLITLKGKGFTLEDRRQLCAQARKVWTAVYGEPRCRSQPRMDRGKTRPLDTLDPSSERAFLRERRLQVEEGSADVNVDTAAIPLERSVGQDGWEESHEREVRFQQAKRHARLLEGLSDGTLLDNEYCQADIQNLGEVKAATAKTRRDYNTKRRRIDNVLASPVLPDTRGKTFYTRLALEAPLVKLVHGLGLTETENVLKADVYITENLGSHIDDYLWPSVLQGKLLVSRSFLASGCKLGTTLRYFPACQVARSVHITPGFARDHPDRAVEVLHATDAGPNPKETKWHFVEDAAEFTRLVNKVNRQNKRTTVIVFLADSDVQGGLFPDVQLRVTAETFMDMLARIDRRSTFLGVCGK